MGRICSLLLTTYIVVFLKRDLNFHVQGMLVPFRVLLIEKCACTFIHTEGKLLVADIYLTIGSEVSVSS